ncbi:MAG: hypothetical protein AAFV72_00280 [Cyanobacteria bacterium J06635_1]
MPILNLPSIKFFRGASYGPGPTKVPAEMARRLPRVKRLAVIPETLGTENPIVIEQLEALALINQADAMSELIALPSVGEVSAQAIFATRPEGGYHDYEQLRSLNAELSRVDWDAVEAW